MKTALELQTITIAYQEICAGKDPWIPLGNFMNDLFGNYPTHRAELVREQILLRSDASVEEQQWAAFCAGAVEYLCQEYQLPCPDWVDDPKYTLTESWFHSPAAAKVPRVQERYRQSTPTPFAKRNVFCGNRVFMNKYETPARMQTSAQDHAT